MSILLKAPHVSSPQATPPYLREDEVPPQYEDAVTRRTEPQPADDAAASSPATDASLGEPSFLEERDPPGFVPAFSRYHLGGRVVMDPRLDVDPALLETCVRTWAETPPNAFVRILGTHTETRTEQVVTSNGDLGSTVTTRSVDVTVTDFDIRLPLTPFLFPVGPAGMTSGWHELRAVSEAEPARRGTVLRHVSEAVRKEKKEKKKRQKNKNKKKGKGQASWLRRMRRRADHQSGPGREEKYPQMDSFVGDGNLDQNNDNDDDDEEQQQQLQQHHQPASLTEWYHRYCASHAGLKTFSLERRVIGLDKDAVRLRLEGLVRTSTSYRGTVTVSFPTEEARVRVLSACRTHRSRVQHDWVWWLCVLSLAWVVTWPLLWLRTRCYEVAIAEWSFSRREPLSPEGGGQGGVRYATVSEASMCAMWAPAICAAVRARRDITLGYNDLAGLASTER